MVLIVPQSRKRIGDNLIQRLVDTLEYSLHGRSLEDNHVILHNFVRRCFVVICRIYFSIQVLYVSLWRKHTRVCNITFLSLSLLSVRRSLFKCVLLNQLSTQLKT